MAASIRKWEDLGARLELPATLVSADQVRALFLAFQGGRIELVEPGEGSRIKSTGAHRGLPDHLCFRCDNFDEMIEGVRSSGGVVVRPPVPPRPSKVSGWRSCSTTRLGSSSGSRDERWARLRRRPCIVGAVRGGLPQGASETYGLNPEIVVCGFDRELRLWLGSGRLTSRPTRPARPSSFPRRAPCSRASSREPVPKSLPRRRIPRRRSSFSMPSPRCPCGIRR